MKKKFLSITAGLILTVMASATTFAQSAPVKATEKVFTEKAISSFDRQFGNAVMPAIEYSANGSILLNSKADGRSITSAFTKRGNWVYSIVRYPAVSPDTHILRVVQHNHEARGYEITGMAKVDEPGMETVFIVYLKNNSSYKVLRVSQHTVEVMQHYVSA